MFSLLEIIGKYACQVHILRIDVCQVYLKYIYVKFTKNIILFSSYLQYIYVKFNWNISMPSEPYLYVCKGYLNIGTYQIYHINMHILNLPYKYAHIKFT